MITHLHASRIILVLINLVFVSVTKVASPTWVAPLFLLTLASPWLLRFIDNRIYKSAWNLLVFLAFAGLIRHAIVAGPRHVLEDGLLLAALCQVHLLNNLNRNQRPDLLFFNSFVIAVVTSILCVELDYLLVFLAYVPALVIALQMHVEAHWRESNGPIENEVNGVSARLSYGRHLTTGFLRSALLLAITMGLFAVAPRDFQRKGIVAEQIRMANQSRSQVGFDENISLTPKGGTVQSDEIVMTAELLTGSQDQVSEYWRGSTLDRFDGRHWTASLVSSGRSEHPWKPMGTNAWRRIPYVYGPKLLVNQMDTRSRKLFLPLEAIGLSLEGGGSVAQGTLAHRDLTIRLPRGYRGPIMATATLSRTHLAPTANAAQSDAYLRYPDDLPDSLTKVFAEIKAGIAETATSREWVEAVRT
jgi:hypothetical protein